MNTASMPRLSFFNAPARDALRLLSVAVLFAIALVSILAPLQAQAATVSLGVMGDSLSDEYAYNGRAYAQNWVEQLAASGNVNLGAVGNYASPRNTGYAYNWALSGATTSSLLSGGQASGLALQIPGAGINYAVLSIGANDFFPTSTAYQNIYNGTWSTTTINNYVNQTVSNINTALNTVLPTGVHVVVATIPDYGFTPFAHVNDPIAAQRDVVAAVINQVNTGIKGLAQADHIVVADLAALAAATFGTNLSPHTTVSIGNVTINLTQTTGSNPSPAAFVSDGIHPNTALQGVIANLYMQALNTGYQTSVPLFTEQQILTHNGLPYGGSDTLAGQIGPYSNFVISYVPEPSTETLVAIGVAFFGLACRNGRRRGTTSKT